MPIRGAEDALEVIESDSGTRALEALLRYIFATRDDIAPEGLKTMVAHHLAENKGDKVMSLAQRLIQEGMEKGMEKGMQEGMQKGMQEGKQEGRREGLQEGIQQSIVDILETRFDIIRTAIIEKIASVNNIMILRSLHKKAVTAESLEQFEKTMHRILDWK
jgi:hypothetical protein